MIKYASNQEIIRFIQDHLSDDPDLLALAKDKYPGIPIGFVSMQIATRQKSLSKLPFLSSVPEFIFPSKRSYEQSSSEVTASYKSTLYSGNRFLDLTGGLGIDSHFISKKFKHSVYVEREEETFKVAKHNFQVLKNQSIELLNLSAEKYITGKNHDFDLIFLDPSRRDSANRRKFKLEDCEPDILGIKDSLFKICPKVLIKTAPLLDIKLAIKKLGHVSRVDILAVANETREVLYHLERNFDGIPEISAINFKGNEKQVFSFTYPEEESAVCNYNLPGEFLYEPNNALLKAGAFKLPATFYGLDKLHPNTHLYSGNNIISEFPGRKFKIIGIVKPNKKEIERFIPGLKANVNCRNYPMTVEQLRKKTGLKDGGDFYVFATQTIGDQKILLITIKIKV